MKNNKLKNLSLTGSDQIRIIKLWELTGFYMLIFMNLDYINVIIAVYIILIDEFWNKWHQKSTTNLSVNF